MWSTILLCIHFLIPILTGTVLSGSLTVGSVKTIDVSVSIDTTLDTVDIILVGPSDRYFSIGFGTSAMNNAYAIIVSGTSSNPDVKEYSLSKSSPSQATDLATQMISVTSDTTDTGTSTRTVIITRARVQSTTDHYEFPNTDSDISIIWAHDDQSGTGISKHGQNTYGTGISITVTAPTSPPTTTSPSTSPTLQPTLNPVTSDPTSSPFTQGPTKAGETSPPTTNPTYTPTSNPSNNPTNAPSKNPTVSPTIYPRFETCTDMQEIVSGVSVIIGRNTVDRSMIIDISGPSNKWFGIGFGALEMDGSYSITVEGDTLSVVERILGDQALMGSVIDTDSYTDGEIITTDDGTTRSISIIRPWNDATNTYDFTSFMECTEWSIDMISAVGSMTTIAYHSSRDWKTVNRTCLCDESQTSSPTQAPSTTSPTTEGANSGCGKSDVLSAEGIELDDFMVDINIDCATETVIVDITFNAYNNGWFGIVFSDSMIGNALVWTTNNANNDEDVRDLSLYPYSITNRRDDMVRYDGTESDWTELQRVVESDTVFLSYSTSLDATNIFSLETERINMRWAKGDGSSFVLSQHSPSDKSSETFSVDLLSGQVSVTKDDLTLETVHGVIMFVTWAVLASIGIMSSSFRFLYPQGPRWFKVHRAVQYTVFGLNLVGFIIAIVFTTIKEKPHFANKHMVMGLCVVIFASLQPFNAYFRPHVPEQGEMKSAKRFVWEILHKSLGYIAWICGCITIVFGLWLIDEETLGYVHLFVWCGLLLVFYVVCSIVKFMNYRKNAEIEKVNETKTASGANLIRPT